VDAGGYLHVRIQPRELIIIGIGPISWGKESPPTEVGGSKSGSRAL
jgi:hypothetical protein